MKAKVEKNESAMKNKEAEIKKIELEKTKMNEVLKKNGEELESLRKQFANVEEASRIESEALQAQIVAQKSEMNVLEAEVTTTVRAKLMYEYKMKRTSSWDP